MFEAFKNAWKIQDLRKKVFYTLIIILLFRLGSIIPVPFLDPEKLKELFGAGGNNLVDYLDILSGGALSKASIFAMSISPYINASIIMQLLTIAIPALEKMQKEGEEGRKKIQQITRYFTVALGLIQGWGFYNVLNSKGIIENPCNFSMIVITLSFTAGTAIIMWLAEKINENGIGNGISILLFASIVSRGPQIWSWIWQGNLYQGDVWNYVTVAAVGVVACLMIASIVLINNSERRLPIQYAKRVVGRKMYGGQNTHLPIKVSMTGVMPIIFAQSFVMMPSTIATFLGESNPFSLFVKNRFNYASWPYGTLLFLLIISFNFFYIYISYNPIEIANNLQKNGGFIPGIRPGDSTSNFIQKVLNKITLLGALFLGVIAVMPIIMSGAFGVNLALGGTTILIVVGVVLETSRQLESQMLMRHYKGFLE